MRSFVEKNIKTYKISYDLNDPEPPKPHEQYAARIVSDYFESDIVFIRKKAGSSPDFIIVRSNQIWELKSPFRNAKFKRLLVIQKDKKILTYDVKKGKIIVG